MTTSIDLAQQVSTLRKENERLRSQLVQLRQEQALLQAKQERAAELAKANEALARTSSRLAEQPDLSAFLNHLMLEAMA